MASEQMSRRENATTEREIHVEKNRVPKMTTHFEHLAEHAKESDVTGGKDTPQGSIEELQSGEQRKEHGGRAIGDVGGRGKARETHELGAHFESLADKVKGEKESCADKPRKESQGGGGGVYVPSSDVGKFEVKADGKGSGEEGRGSDRAELESGTRVVTGRMESGAEKEKERREKREQVVADKGRSLENRGEARGRDIAQTEGRTTEGGRGEARNTVEVETQGPAAVITCRLEGTEKEERGRDRREENGGGKGEEKDQATLEEISKYRGQAQENSMEAIRGAQERYEKAKQAASDALGTTTQTAQEKAAKAKNITTEKASQTTQTAQESAAQAKNIAKEKTAQAKDMAAEKGQQSYVATKDTISSATKRAGDYTTPVAEKAKDYTFQAAEMAKSAGGTTAHYMGEKAVQAKDVSVDTGKTAAKYAGKVAADLKDKATVAAWTAAHYSTEKTMEGTKAAADVVQGAAGYAGHKATEIATKSLGAVKGLAAAAGETAKDYTARKKEEAERELVAKKASEQQERPSAKSTGQSFQRGQEEEQREGGGGKGIFGAITESFTGGGGQERKGGGGITETVGQYAPTVKPTEVLTTIGQTVGDFAQRMQKPLDNVTEGGSEVLGAVGETVGEIGKTMIKPAEKVSDQGGKGGSGILGAVGETIVEIAQTTKVLVVGDDEIEAESRINDRGNQGDVKHEERRKTETIRKN